MLSEDLRRAPAPSPALPPERRQLVLRLRSGPYQLPHDIADRLTGALAGFRNRDASFRLAVFVARFWSSRARLATPFPVDRRALADREDLGLTEGEIRGAIRALEDVGYLNRGLPAPGSAYRLTAAGELQRKPILFGFGVEYGPSFAAANARAAWSKAREERRRQVALAVANRRPLASRSRYPKDKAEPERQVIMGKVEGAGGRVRLAEPPASSSPLDLALRRLAEAAGFDRGV